MPTRIQRRRSRGWRMPSATVYVGRPTVWANPFPVGATRSRAQAVTAYRQWLHHQPDLIARVRNELVGYQLACWCPLDQPCHADILLDVANPGTNS